MATPTARLGAKIGPRIAQVVTDAMVDTHGKLTGHKVGVLSHGLQDFAGVVGDEIATHTRGLLHNVADRDEWPAWVAGLLRFMADGRGQGAGVLMSMAVGRATSGMIGQIVNNATAVVTAKILSEAPSLLLDPPTVAALAARGLEPYADMRREAAGSGIDGGRFSGLVSLASTYPDVGSVVQLLNRQVFDHPTALRALQLLGYTAEGAADVLHLSRDVIPPAVAADMVVRGILSESDGATVAALSGVTAADFALIVQDTGEPPAPEQLDMALRRNIIDVNRYAHGIRQGRTKNEWLDVLEALRYSPPSLGDVLSAAVQNHLPPATARRLASENGLDPQWFDSLLATHGRPPGPTEMLSLYNRGQVSESDVVQAIRESDVKDKYIPSLLDLRRHLIPERTLVSAINKGALTPAQATTRLLELGFTPQDAAILLKMGMSESTQKHRDLAESQVLDLYAAHAIGAAKASAMLHSLGYSDTAVTYIMSLGDLARVRRFTETVVGTVHARFTHRVITHAEASSELDSLGVDHASRDALLSLWALEQGLTITRLTAAQIAKGVKHGVFTEPEGLARLEQLGYSADDAADFLAIENGA
jgi:hypothetical protein